MNTQPSLITVSIVGVTLIFFCLSFTPNAVALPQFEVGFASTEITPEVSDSAPPVWLAGYGIGREATGVHDPLFARAVVFKSGEEKIAMVSVDLVGLQYPQTLAIRARLTDFDYVLIASTHNHEGPDVIGIWGPTRFASGVNPAYLKLVEDRVVEAVELASTRLVRAESSYGTAENEELLSDSRKPEVKDGILRLLSFTPPDRPDATPLGILVQWNCHPENLGSQNTLVTADFPYAVIDDLEARYGCPVVYLTGAIGGLMSAPEDVLTRPDGTYYREGEFEFAEAYGKAVAKLADEALRFADPIALTPFQISSEQVALPLVNTYYRAARGAGVLDRPAYTWTGDPLQIGEKRGSRDIIGELAVVTEVAYLRLGDLQVAAIPGELYPELIDGRFQEPVEPDVDFPEADLEPTIFDSLPDNEFCLILGLANDEIGYIIPKRQWDNKAPFAYGRDRSQYGEINSVGANVAPILLQAFQRCVANVGSAEAPQ